MSSQNIKAVGDGIRERRERVGMTAKVLADAVGVSPQFISDIERGRRDVTRETASGIAAHLGWSPDWIDLMMGRIPTTLLKDNYTDDDIDGVRMALTGGIEGMKKHHEIVVRRFEVMARGSEDESVCWRRRYQELQQAVMDERRERMMEVKA